MSIWIVDAFTDRVFTGNPAAVVPLERWLPDATLQAIATENKLSETAFVVPTGLQGNYQLRWFTPATEVPLCGHATLGGRRDAAFRTRADLGGRGVRHPCRRADRARDARRATRSICRAAQRTPWTRAADIAEALGDPRVVDAFVGEYANVVLDDEAGGARPEARLRGAQSPGARPAPGLHHGHRAGGRGQAVRFRVALLRARASASTKIR